MGRPTDSPKNMAIKFRIDDSTQKQLEKCSEALNISKSEVLRQGVHRIYDDLKNKRKF